MSEMDGENDKVFVSKIKRNATKPPNNFFDILQKEVKEPLKPTLRNEEQDECEFKPRVNQYYVPKKNTKFKVATVREIRKLYEKNIFETLPLELERQEKYLLRKIRGGYYKDKDTKKKALKLLKSDKPLSRSSWQMLVNLNPKGHTYSSQYFLWNGRRIQISGSKGGENKFICNYDVNKKQEFPRKPPVSKKKIQTRRALLRDSLNIRFKPGPLQKKQFLDESYQKYHVGEIKVIDLPEIGLNIKPSYGTALDPKVTTFVQNMRELDGTISEKWAEFAVSVLGKATEEGTQIEPENSVTFNLDYKCDQKRILMRNDLASTKSPENEDVCRPLDVPITICNDDLLTQDIKNVLSRMLDSVEISLNQHSMYSGLDEPRDTSSQDSTYNTSRIQVKEKAKKRKCCELDRLDVTVIRVSEKRKRSNSEPCQQLFCSLGCVCDSLECSYQIKDHCGKIECMFGCNCDFSKCKIADSLDGNCSEMMPGLIDLDEKINNKLTKEEQRFQQTLVVTADNRILLKSRKRNWKSSKKYADFYSSMPLRTDFKNQKIPEIRISKLKCENIEPWCMVHNLYKCFCKGKFVQSYLTDSSDVDTIPSLAYKDRGVASVLDKPLTVLETVLEKTLPVRKRTLPFIEKTLPVLVKPSPAIDKTAPAIEKTSPALEKTSPAIEKTSPAIEKTPHVLEKTLLVLEKRPSVLEKTPPVLGKTPPVLGKTLPVIEKTLLILLKTQPVSTTSENNVSIKNDTKAVDSSSGGSESPDSSCARLLPLYNRKFKEDYYRRTNEKIFEMEKNDKKLQSKLMSLINGSEQTDETQTQNKLLNVTDEIIENMENIKIPIKTSSSDNDIKWTDSLCARFLPFESRKYGDEYYRTKNEVISKLEKKDKTLRSKLMTLITNARECDNPKADVTQTQDNITNETESSSNPNELLSKAFLEHQRTGTPSASASKIEIENMKPRTKLMKWLETNLTKDFIETIENGNWTTSLSRPSLGKVALYPWKFILSRYREKKNLFLISTQKPFRIFMAVNARSPFFENCINVAMISKSRMRQYPDMVRNLINNTIHDNFCILSGLSHCWELVGSVNKVNKQFGNNINHDYISESIFIDESSDESKKDIKKLSRWFIMTIEDDIRELRFSRKGFFVKYDSIIRSVNVARRVGKTVRLSSHKSNQDANDPKFGIYATADRNANTLFIGPYDEDEPLGIETARNSQEIYKGRKTGGVWITVNRDDNLRVTDDPLLFLPPPQNDCDSVITLDSDTDYDSDTYYKKRISSTSENADLSDERSSLNSNTKAETTKVIKPIRIRKTDSFYHLGSPSLMTQLALTKCLQQGNRLDVKNISLGPDMNNVNPMEIMQPGCVEVNSQSCSNKPVAEIAPQIKINDISSLCSNNSTTELPSNKRKFEGMFVLKPEEINKRLANNYFRILEPFLNHDVKPDENLSSEEQRLDVEEFLDSSVICPEPSDIYVISDDDEDNDEIPIESVIKNVWITCANIPNIGWISGLRNHDNKLSFEFPGFAITDYYDEEEALDKINQLLARKVCIPKNVHALWQVIENEEDLDGKPQLRKEDLSADIVLTRRGLIHKDKLVKRIKKVKKYGEAGFPGCSPLEISSEETSSKGPQSEEPPSEGPPSGGPPSERPPSEGPPSEGPPSEGPPSEKPPSERPPFEGPPSEGVPSEGVTSEGVTSEGVTSEGVTSEGVTSEGVASEGVTSEGVASEGVTTEGVPSEGPPSEKPPSEVPLSEGPPSEELPPEGGTSEGVPSEGVPSEGVPSDGVTAEGVPSEEVPSDGVTSEGVTSERVPSEEVPSEGAISERLPSEGQPSEGTSFVEPPPKGPPLKEPPPKGPSSERLPSDGPSSTVPNELVKEKSGSGKIINIDKLSNANNTQGNITAVASTSIDADGNDQGIMIYTVTQTDGQKENVNNDPCDDDSIASEVEIVSSDPNIYDSIESYDENYL